MIFSLRIFFKGYSFFFLVSTKILTHTFYNAKLTKLTEESRFTYELLCTRRGGAHKLVLLFLKFVSHFK